MRNADDVQRAHDIMLAILLDEMPGRPRDDHETMLVMMAAADVLCWTLGHPQNERFGEVLANLERDIEAAGYVVAD